MSKIQLLLFEVVIVSLFLISGCKFLITNIDEDEISKTPTNPEINSFTITDSYQQTSFDYDQQVHINGGISGGEFDVSYSASRDGYYVSLALNDRDISDGGITFFNGICGSSSCAVDITCRFTNAINMLCGNIGPSNQEVDVSSLVTAIPMDAYIILEVCNLEYTICVQQYQAIELQ